MPEPISGSAAVPGTREQLSYEPLIRQPMEAKVPLAGLSLNRRRQTRSHPVHCGRGRFRALLTHGRRSWRKFQRLH